MIRYITLIQFTDQGARNGLLIKLAKDGNLRTEAMRCYDKQEFETILEAVS